MSDREFMKNLAQVAIMVITALVIVIGGFNLYHTGV